jgi:hypothetical protein
MRFSQISALAQLTDLLLLGIVAPDVDAAAAADGGGGGAGSSSALLTAPLSSAAGQTCSSLPLPPNLQRLALWSIQATALVALALPTSLTQLHLHELLARRSEMQEEEEYEVIRGVRSQKAKSVGCTAACT